MKSRTNKKKRLVAPLLNAEIEIQFSTTQRNMKKMFSDFIESVSLLIIMFPKTVVVNAFFY